MIDLNRTATYKLPLGDGYLDIRVSQDPEYPGLDIEYIRTCPHSVNGECELSPEENLCRGSESEMYACAYMGNNESHTRPRVLIELPKDTGKLRCLVWGDPKSEDYSECVEFTDVKTTQWIISKKEAEKIAKTAAALKEFGTLASTGYYSVFDVDEDASRGVAIDISKERDEDYGHEYFTVYISSNAEDGSCRHTKSLDVKELTELILDIAQESAKNSL